ncbi:MAG: hypothetical protein JEZ01_19485 [Labilibaculum sp.]|jgi:hypothetical protein|nr:hypothetical protein [Labilibaculum sp.]MBI9059957.1 hypothetical protein [Labilibaculum sp.]
MSLNLTNKTKYILLFTFAFIAFVGNINAQEDERWKLSVNNDQKPLEILMEFGDSEMGITYLFDITRDTLNMSFAAEESISWKKHGVSVFALPKGKEVLKIKLDDVDMENVQVVFYRMWKAMPKNFKNVTTLFELHEYGTTSEGAQVKNFIIRFKMKRPRRRNSIQL